MGIPLRSVTNNARGPLLNTISAGALSFTVQSGWGALFPSSNFRVTHKDYSAGVLISQEIMHITSRTGDVFTVETRAVESCPRTATSTSPVSTAYSFTAYTDALNGTVVELTPTASMVSEISEELDTLNTSKLSITDYISGAKLYSTSTTGNDSYVITLPDVTTYAQIDGQSIRVKVDVANIGAATLNINALGVKEIRKLGDVVLGTGDIKAGQIIELVWNNTGNRFELLNSYDLSSTITAAIGFVTKFSGDGSDGNIDGTSNVTITGSNNTVIYRNYASWGAGTAPRIFTVTPTGCTLIIKIQGNCDLSNWTFNFSGKGAAGGAGGVYAGAGPVAGTSMVQFYYEQGNIGGGATGGGGGASNEASATGTGNGITTTPLSIVATQERRLIQLYCGAGGGGGNAGGGPSSGGNGGAGGGAVILQIGGNLTVNNTTTIINMSGVNGGNATAGGGGINVDGGGGGGGGQFLALYNGTMAGTVTPAVNGGTGGTAIGSGQVGRAGANGGSLIAKNITFT